ncbi:nitrate- and nitrite sensing domain-containing protein [Streptomyces sp. NPDC002133]|uniref:sensor histidine kinase n=1 Tax=Streptomyces sp. NPDC002133 TaxID=3154409 RepID=UPI0033324FA2
MQKKRPRGKGGMPGTASSGREASTPATPAGNPTGTSPAGPASAGTGHEGLVPGGRSVRVRSRLVAGVAAVSLTVVAAGAPAVLTASDELAESQQLVTLAELNRQAVTLAHSMADERDEVTAYIAAGRDDQTGPKKNRRAVSASHSARVDRQIDEIRGNLPADHADLTRGLATVPSVRRTALGGKGTALEAYKAYTDIIATLHALADELAESTPARAWMSPGTESGGGTRAPAALGLAVEQASASRGLLIAALSVPEPSDDGPSYDPITGLPVEDEGDKEAEAARNALSAAAQQARVRELAALADFDQAASSDARDRLGATVTGPDVKTAEGYLTRLTDQPELSEGDLKSNRERLESSLSARIEQMRGVESALASAQVERLGQLRDDDVTALELRIALLGGCLLVAIGISAAVARTLTRPLAVLRIGAARLAAAPAAEAEEPVRFTGRNDEFAQVVRSLNALHGKLVDLAARADRLDTSHDDLAATREELATQRAELQGRVTEVTEQLEQLRKTVGHTFVNLSLRTLGLVERQLGVIEKLEEREQDPERLATLFKLDHMATVMRRHSENLLVLAGAEHGHAHAGPVPLVDVMRAAVSEIERYERITIQSLPPHAQVAGFAADDLSHLVAELLENATSFSPPDAQVELSGWLLESGEVMLSVQDEGIGMAAARLEELNARLADPEPAAGVDGEGLGLRVAALLARRHGVRVQLREQKQGGIAVVVVLPKALLPTAPPIATPQATPMPGDAPMLNLPGSVAEANSNALPGRSAASDRLIAAAEQSVRAAEAEEETEAGTDAEAGTGTDVDTEAGTGTGTDVDAEAENGPEPERTTAMEPATAQEPAAVAETTAPVPAPAPEPATTPETTLQVRLPHPSPEPDAHERVADGVDGADRVDGAEEAGVAGVAGGPDVAEPVTDKGLPKRTPKIVAPATPLAGSTRTVDAEALRRRLGGFHQGAKDGRRDVEAELAETTQNIRIAVQEDQEHSEESGDTVEEARS